MALNPNVPSVKLSLPERAWLAIAAGMSGDGAATAIALSEPESGGYTNAVNRNSNGTIDRGVVQWNNGAHPEITDGMAYNPYQAFEWMARKTNGGTNFGHWSPRGPARYASPAEADAAARARISSALMSDARAAVAAPQSPEARLRAAGWTRTGGSPVAGGPGVAGSGVIDWIDVVCPNATPGERALLTQWGVEDNNWRIREADDEWEYSEIDDEPYKVLSEVVNSYVNNDGTLRTGWLHAVLVGLGYSDGAVLSPSMKSSLQQLIHARQNRYGGPDPGLLDSIGLAVAEGDVSGLPGGGAIEATGDALGAVGDALGKFVGIITSAEWWKRIGIGALGVALVIGVVFITTRTQAIGATTDGNP